MKISKKVLLALACCLAVIFSMILCQTSDYFSRTDTVLCPFEIAISDLRIISNSSGEPELSLTIFIENTTEQEFRNVWFEVSLNNEVEPYIASHILTFTSEKMNVTTKVKAQKNINDLNVYGFMHEWKMLLTSKEDLKEYYNLTSESVYSTLNEATVNIYWENGQQSNTIPISLMN